MKKTLIGLFSSFVILVVFVMVATPPLSRKSPAPIEFQFIKQKFLLWDIPDTDYSALRITRNGVVYDYQLSRNEDRDGYDLASLVLMKDLDGDNEIELVLNLMGCGSYCLTNFRVVYYDRATDQYLGTEDITRKISVVEEANINPNGITEFSTRNEPFIFRVGGSTGVSYIGPIQILRFQDHRLVDVTAEYPELVQDDARGWLASITGEETHFSELYTQITGISEINTDPQQNEPKEDDQRPYILHLAAYVADMCALGNCDAAWPNYIKLCVNYLDEEGCTLYFKEIQENLDDTE